MSRVQSIRPVKTDDDEIPDNAGRTAKHPCNALVLEWWENEKLAEAKALPYGWWTALPEFASNGETATILLRYADDHQKWKVTVRGQHEPMERIFLHLAQAKREVLRSNGREVTEVRIEKG